MDKSTSHLSTFLNKGLKEFIIDSVISGMDNHNGSEQMIDMYFVILIIIINIYSSTVKWLKGFVSQCHVQMHSAVPIMHPYRTVSILQLSSAKIFQS